jgi:hypothetical protein
MRNRAFRRRQTACHMWRRLKEDRNQRYDKLNCVCWHDPKALAKFKEQPKTCDSWMCSNQRATFGPKLQERKFFAADRLD